MSYCFTCASGLLSTSREHLRGRSDGSASMYVCERDSRCQDMAGVWYETGQRSRKYLGINQSEGSLAAERTLDSFSAIEIFVPAVLRPLEVVEKAVLLPRGARGEAVSRVVG